MNKTYTVVLNTYNDTSSQPLSYITNFLFDWSIFENQDYIVYTYLATNRYIYKNNTLQYPYMLINTDAFQGLTYTNTDRIQNKNINLLGYIYPTTAITGLSYSYWVTTVGLNNNIPTYIQGRPTKNQFYIQLLNGDLTNTFTNQEYDIAEYLLTMKFIPAQCLRNIINKSDISRQITFQNFINREKKQKQSYNIVFNVLNANNLTYDVSGNVTNNRNLRFYFDWSVVLPADTAFEVYSTSLCNYRGGWVGSSYQSYPIFSIDCFPMLNYEANDIISTKSTTRLSIIYPTRQQNNENFPTNWNMNEPVYLTSRPFLNDFSLSIRNNNNSGQYGFNIGNWILSLKFVPLD